MKRVLRCLILVLAVLGLAASASATPTIIFMGDPMPAAIDTVGGLHVPDLNITWMDSSDTPLYTHYANHVWHGLLSIAPDGAMALTGEVSQLPGASGLLLTGTVLGWAWDGLDLTMWGRDTKTPALLGALGFPADQLFADFSLIIRHVPNTRDSFFVEGLTNTAVPEPGTLLLFGSGLFGLSTIVRRRLRR